MDNITVDLGPDPEPAGAPVALIGDGVRAEDLAERLGTNNYEVTCGISPRVPREHHRDGEPA
jgi:alanine racemase